MSKGNARTYGLNGLTSVVHDAEQAYDEQRKENPPSWDQIALLEQLALVGQAVADYQRVNEEKLGRKGPGRRGSVDRFLMVEKATVESVVHEIEAVVDLPVDVESAQLRLRKALSSLKRFGTEEIDSVVSGIVESLPDLSRELGKAVPEVRIYSRGIAVRSQVAGLLKNAFTHLIRNSVDHGLESPEQRLSSGKPANGVIRLEAEVDDQNLTLALSDDGRGLALARIRKMAIEKGMLSAEAAACDIAAASAILQPGFSTAEAVTEISGRGVGMDAVKAFLEREGGSIRFEFTDQVAGADYQRWC